MAGSLKKSSSVTCLECSKEYKSLISHLHTHSLTVDQYKQKYLDPVTGAEPEIGSNVNDRKSAPKKAEKPVKHHAPELGLAKGLDLASDEKRFYEERFSTLFIQADEDPALRSCIHELVLGEIFVSRYQKQINKISNDLLVSPLIANTDLLETLDKRVKDTQKHNLNLMDSLNLTRKAKKSTKQTVQSTPSKLATAWQIFAKNFPPEQAARHELEVLEASKLIMHNLEEIKKAIGKQDDSTTELDSWLST